jgi:hypothetical protein
LGSSPSGLAAALSTLRFHMNMMAVLATRLVSAGYFTISNPKA